MVQPFRSGDGVLAQRYEEILSNSNYFRIEPITTATARYAADLRARYNLRTPDALHIAAAITSGCDAFLTNDTDIKRVLEITVLTLDELELDVPQT